MSIKSISLTVIFLVLSTHTYAVGIHLVPDGVSFTNFGSYSAGARGIYIGANDNFTLSRVGWSGSIVSGEYEITINQGMGETEPLGAELASFGQPLTAAGNTINYIDVDYTFLAGAEYHIDFHMASGELFSTLFQYAPWGNGSQQEDFGLFTLLDGTSSPDVGGAGNFWLTHFVLYVEPAVVPIPSSVWLFGSGLLGLVGVARRKKA